MKIGIVSGPMGSTADYAMVMKVIGQGDYFSQ